MKMRGEDGYILKEADRRERLLRRTEATIYVTDTFGIPCSPKTLAKLACISSDGPPFRLAGRFPLYPLPASTPGRKARSVPSFARPPKCGALPNPRNEKPGHTSPRRFVLPGFSKKLEPSTKIQTKTETARYCRLTLVRFATGGCTAAPHPAGVHVTRRYRFTHPSRMSSPILPASAALGRANHAKQQHESPRGIHARVLSNEARPRRRKAQASTRNPILNRIGVQTGYYPRGRGWML